MLVNPSGGSVDSGYADVFLATAMTGAAAGLTLGHARVLVASIFLAVLVKPEGIVQRCADAQASSAFFAPALRLSSISESDTYSMLGTLRRNLGQGRRCQQHGNEKKEKEPA